MQIRDFVKRAVVDPGEPRGARPPPVKISHKKGHQRQPHRFHVSQHPYQAVGSATGRLGGGNF